MNKILVCMFVAAAAAFANASELWWTVSPTTGDAKDVSWDTVAIYASADGSNFGGTKIQEYSSTVVDNLDYIATDISGYSATTSFYLELVASKERVAASYVDLASGDTRAQGAATSDMIAKAMYNGGMSTSSVTPYSFTNFTTSQVVPEPTSGLMILLGLAALGLKRKRA